MRGEIKYTILAILSFISNSATAGWKISSQLGISKLHGGINLNSTTASTLASREWWVKKATSLPELIKVQFEKWANHDDALPIPTLPYNGNVSGGFGSMVAVTGTVPKVFPGIGGHPIYPVTSQLDKDSIDFAIFSISFVFNYFRDRIKEVFPENAGFELSEFKNVYIDPSSPTNQITFYPVTLTNKNLPTLKVKVLRGSGINHDGSSPETIEYGYFIEQKILKRRLCELTCAGLYDLPAALDEAYSAAENDAPRGSKLKMLFGGSVGYSHTFMENNKKFGLYTGAELFFDTCPNRTNISKNSIGIKQNNIGITPFIGIAAKDSWMIYAIGGPKLSFKNLSFQNTIIKKTKVEFEVGAGTDYMLTDHFAVGFRYLKTLKSNVKFKHNYINYNLRTSSSKFIVSLSYIF